MKLVLPFPPTANAYWRSVVIAGRVRVLLSSEARAYKKACELAATAQSKGIIEGPVKVRADYYFPTLQGDLDNRLKQLLDGLQGPVLVNDSQIVEIHAVRLLDRRNPRVEVELGAA